MRSSLTIAAALAAGLAAAPALAQDMTAKAQLKGPDGAEMGTVTLTQTANDGVLIQLEATGLAAGEHAFHIHQTGQCEPDFTAAGDHYAPDGNEHGYLNEAGHHAGDLPNVVADSDGKASADVFTTRVSLQQDAPNTVFDEDGSAFIIHENPDSYQADAGAGGRVACGVIEQAQQ